MAIESTEGEKHKQLDREIRDMISALTNRLSDLQGVQKPGGSSHQDDEHGVKIITLAGSNVGATLRSELDEKGGVEGDEHEPLGTLVNSNFQAINNSIMMGGSYSTNDPGVHMDVTDSVELPQANLSKHGKKGKKKEKEERSTEYSS